MTQSRGSEYLAAQSCSWDSHGVDWLTDFYREEKARRRETSTWERNIDRFSSRTHPDWPGTESASQAQALRTQDTEGHCDTTYRTKHKANHIYYSEKISANDTACGAAAKVVPQRTCCKGVSFSYPLDFSAIFGYSFTHSAKKLVLRTGYCQGLLSILQTEKQTQQTHFEQPGKLEQGRLYGRTWYGPPQGKPRQLLVHREGLPALQEGRVTRGF